MSKESESQAHTVQQPLLALPAPSDEQLREVKVGGEGVMLNHLGPIVINTDGSIARITNWDQLSSHEQSTSLRLIAKRNKHRLETLRAQAVGAEDKTADPAAAGAPDA